jgi:carbon storage regulator
MLVLSRKPGESIMVGPVTVTVVDISHDRVKLAFEAPGEVPIHREEVYARIQAEQLAQGGGRQSRFASGFA